jgi:hypothetical protein
MPLEELTQVLTTLNANHFNTHHDEINWGDVGTLNPHTNVLRQIIDCTYKEGDVSSPYACPVMTKLGLIEGCRMPRAVNSGATMTEPTETQPITLSAGPQRANNLAMPLPKGL